MSDKLEKRLKEAEEKGAREMAEIVAKEYLEGEEVSNGYITSFKYHTEHCMQLWRESKEKK